MPNREKVLAALKNCLDVPQCRDCPWEECEEEHEHVEMPRGLVEAAVELLKGQEPVKPILAHIGNYAAINDYTCPVCKSDLYHLQKYCDECGRRVKWE